MFQWEYYINVYTPWKSRLIFSTSIQYIPQRIVPRIYERAVKVFIIVIYI